jgi:hypothetical protein
MATVRRLEGLTVFESHHNRAKSLVVHRLAGRRIIYFDTEDHVVTLLELTGLNAVVLRRRGNGPKDGICLQY